MGVLLIPGTDAWHPSDPHYADWYTPGSQFTEFLSEHNVDPLPGERTHADFVWSTEVDGLPSLLMSNGGGLRGWHASGNSLCQYLVPRRCPDAHVSGAQTNIIAHSHGAQVVFFAASLGLKINKLITVCSPVRHDMADIIEHARPNIREWTHLHSDGSDHVQILGQLFDRAVSLDRSFTLADQNVLIPRVGHSGLLHDPVNFPLWLERGWLKGL